MSSPFLDLAIGALKGGEANRARRIAEEQRKRQQEREDLATRLQLAELSEHPDFDVERFPFVQAALEPAAGGEPAGGPGTEMPAMPPPPPPPAARHAGIETTPSGPQAEDIGLMAPGGGGGGGAGIAPGGVPHIEPTPPGASLPPPPPPPVPGMPPTPHLDQALDLGRIKLGQDEYGIRAHPGRQKHEAEAQNRAAYEALHHADPEAYPAYIPNMKPGYYAEELSDYSQGVRAGRIADKRAAREGRTAASRQAVEQRRDAARDQVFSLAQEGKPFEEIVAAMNQDHDLRGVLTRSEIRREIQSAGQINAPPRDVASAMATLKAQLGKATTPTGEAGPIPVDLQQDVIEGLARGHSPEEVLQSIAESERPEVKAAYNTVKRWLRRGHQIGYAETTP